LKPQGKNRVPLIGSGKGFSQRNFFARGLRKKVKIGILRPHLKIMSKAHLKIMALVIPNFCLFYAYAWSSFQVMPERREAFGSPDLYLDIKYTGIPNGRGHRATSEAVEFDGVLATDFDTNQVRGRRFKIDGNTWYTFYLGDKKFLGWLAQGRTGCEPELQYRLEKDGKILKTGKMKAGFCS
jgi:hypothetical protein